MKGFTLIELMIVMAITLIVAAMAVPSLALSIQSRKIHMSQVQVTQMLIDVRQRSLERGLTYTICPTRNSISCGRDWDYSIMAFEDKNNNKRVDSNENVAEIYFEPKSTWRLVGPKRILKFTPEGLSTPASLRFCDLSNRVNANKAVAISLQGRITQSRDINHDGIDELADGSPIDCG